MLWICLNSVWRSEPTMCKLTCSFSWPPTCRHTRPFFLTDHLIIFFHHAHREYCWSWMEHTYTTKQLWLFPDPVKNTEKVVSPPIRAGTVRWIMERSDIGGKLPSLSRLCTPFTAEVWPDMKLRSWAPKNTVSPTLKTKHQDTQEQTPSVDYSRWSENDRNDYLATQWRGASTQLWWRRTPLQ